MITPWTKQELVEIALWRSKGWEESRIKGWMKTGNNRKGMIPALPMEDGQMATKKAGKKSTKKVAAKKTTAKKKAPGKKPTAKPGRKAGGFQVGDTLTAVKGMDDSFYKKFPRYAAYQMIVKKGKMKTAAFVDAVEKLEGVKTRGQALGILTKLIDKGCVKASGKVKKA